MTQGKRTAELIERAKRLRRGKLSLKTVSAEVGVSVTVLRGWLDPAVAAKERERKRLQCVALRQAAGPTYKNVPERGRLVDADAVQRLKEIPVDDRSLDARLTGLPLQGRSALDRRLRP